MSLVSRRAREDALALLIEELGGVGPLRVCIVEHLVSAWAELPRLDLS